VLRSFEATAPASQTTMPATNQRLPNPKKMKYGMQASVVSSEPARVVLQPAQEPPEPVGLQLDHQLLDHLGDKQQQPCLHRCDHGDQDLGELATHGNSFINRLPV